MQMLNVNFKIMKHIIILTFLTLLFSCSNPRKDMHLKETFYDLSLIKKSLTQENYLWNSHLAVEYVNEPKLKELIQSVDKLNEITKGFINPNDSIKFYDNLSGQELKSKFDSATARMLRIFAGVTDERYHIKFIDEKILKNIINEYPAPKFLELSDNNEVRVFNILTNQINLLSLMLIYKRELYANSGIEDNYRFTLRTIDNKSNKVGEKHSEYLLFIIKTPTIERKNIVLTKMTLNGKDYKTDYNFEQEDSLTTFNFKPTKPGKYEWVVTQYVMKPDGTNRAINFLGKVIINE
jgi:hypothetical protein